MKILHVTPSYKPAFVYGGPTLSVSQLCEHQAAIGEEVTVISTTANGLAELPSGQLLLEGVKVQYFKRITGDHTHYSPALLRYLWKYCRAYDIIHIHSWWNLVSVLAALICWLKGIQPILSPRGMLSNFTFTQGNSIKKKIIHHVGGKWLLKQTILHATSQLEWQDASVVHSEWKGFILPNIIDLPTKNFPRTTSSSTLRIVFLSRIHTKKGLELAMRALAQCDFPFQLEIYGDGDKEYINRLKDLAIALKIDSSMMWKGWVAGEAKYNALANAHLFILTSYNENFANVVLESLSVGTPVLVSKQVGMYDYVERSGSGWVCELSVDSIKRTVEDAYAQFNKIIVDVPQVYHDFDGTYLSKLYINEYQQKSHASKVDYHHSNV